MSEFIWGAVPYVAFAVLIVGTLYRYATGERGWSSKSSQFLAKSSLKFAGPMFHLGLAMAFGGHFIGILIPKFLTDGAGIDEHLYHIIALAGGIPAGILFFLGFFLLMQRRFGNPRMKVNTSKMDGLLYLILFAAIATGCLATALNASGILGDFNYRETISVWFRSLLIFQPDISVMENVPLIFKCHLLCAMTLITIFPFTRLVHCISGGIAFIEMFLRSPIIYRRK